MEHTFCFAIRAWGVGSGEAMLDVLLVEEHAELASRIAEAIVCEHASAGELRRKVSANGYTDYARRVVVEESASDEERLFSSLKTAYCIAQTWSAGRPKLGRRLS